MSDNTKDLSVKKPVIYGEILPKEKRAYLILSREDYPNLYNPNGSVKCWAEWDREYYDKIWNKPMDIKNDK